MAQLCLGWAGLAAPCLAGPGLAALDCSDSAGLGWAGLGWAGLGLGLAVPGLAGPGLAGAGLAVAGLASGCANPHRLELGTPSGVTVPLLVHVSFGVPDFIWERRF